MLNKPAVGQIGLIPNHNTLVAKVIDWATKSPVHHVIVCVDDQHCVEAQPGGAIKSPLSKWPQAIWSDFPLSSAQSQGVADWAIKHIGTPYSFGDDAAIAIGLLLNKWAGDHLQRYLSNDKHLQCAQLADMALAIGGGYHVFNDDRPSGAVFPGSFVQVFKDNGWWE